MPGCSERQNTEMSEVKDKKLKYERPAACPPPRTLRERWLPFALAASSYLLSLVWLLWRTWKIDRWQQLYSVDDPYIHLAIVKTLRMHASYGVTPYHFSSASSSVIWPFLMAGLMFVFGVKAWLAYALNVALSLLPVYLLDRWLAEDEHPPRLRALSVLGVVLLVPLSSLTTLGLEHVLQTLAFLGLLFAATRYWTSFHRGAFVQLALWTTLATSVRYELSFTVASICAITVYLRFRELPRIFLLGFCGLIPIIGFGIFSLLHPGSHFFPNSLLMKTYSGSQGLSARVPFAAKNLHYFATHFLIIPLLVVAILAVVAVRRARRLTPRTGLALAVLSACVLQILFAATGQGARYEAFLVAGLVAALAVLVRELSITPSASPGRVVLALAAVGAAALIPRAGLVTLHAPFAIQQIYLQQYQMARFFSTELPDSAAATNDIGAVDFYTHSPNFDMYGLASNEVMEATLSGTYNSAKMQQMTDAAGVRVVAIYRGWFNDLPPRWVYVGSLTPLCPGLHNTVGGATIAIYATHPDDAPAIHRKLAHFAPSLPALVKVTQNSSTTFCFP